MTLEKATLYDIHDGRPASRATAATVRAMREAFVKCDKCAARATHVASERMVCALCCESLRNDGRARQLKIDLARWRTRA